MTDIILKKILLDNKTNIDNMIAKLEKKKTVFQCNVIEFKKNCDQSREKSDISDKISVDGLIGFYNPGHETDIDVICKCKYFGNFYPCKIKVKPPGKEEIEFSNLESAFQALKWWDLHANTFKNMDGNEAFNFKKKLKHPDRTYCGYRTNWNAMWELLKIKFNQNPELNYLLKSISPKVFIIEHNETKGRDRVWSDNNDGYGMNWLGLQLMLLRIELRNESQSPSERLKTSLDHFITNLSREWRNGKYIDDGKNKWKTGFSTNDENINIYLRCWKYFVENAAIKCNEETKKI